VVENAKPDYANYYGVFSETPWDAYSAIVELWSIPSSTKFVISFLFSTSPTVLNQWMCCQAHKTPLNHDLPNPKPTSIERPRLQANAEGSRQPICS
jgi:hypothetical protein